MDTQVFLLCAFLPSVALRTTNRHTISFICCLKSISKWIRKYPVTNILKIFTKWIPGYVVTEYPRNHLSLGVAFKVTGMI